MSRVRSRRRCWPLSRWRAPQRPRTRRQLVDGAEPSRGCANLDVRRPRVGRYTTDARGRVTLPASRVWTAQPTLKRVATRKWLDRASRRELDR